MFGFAVSNLCGWRPKAAYQSFDKSGDQQAQVPRKMLVEESLIMYVRYSVITSISIGMILITAGY